MTNLPSLDPNTYADMLTFCSMLAKSTMIPREYQNQPANIALAIGWGRPLGLSAIQCLNAVAVINGKPAMYGDALLGVVRASHLCEDVVEHFEGTGDDMIAICEARRRGAAPVTARFSVADAKRAGLWGKSGPWTQYPTRMLQMRSRGFALRDAFPDLLRGIISTEEAEDMPSEPKDITPATVTAELDAFAADTQETETVTDDLEPDQGEVDELLSVARAITFKGYKDFRQWYLQEIDDDKRLALRPHVKSLMEAAHKADEDVPAGPPSFPPRRRRIKPSEPTHAEIERSQDMLATVLGPDEITDLDPAP